MHIERESHTLTHRHGGEREGRRETYTHTQRQRQERMGVLTHV